MPAQPLMDVSGLKFSPPLMDREKIATLLPHRDALALVDGVAHLDKESLLAAGWKDVGHDEFWNSGHFPGNPILPGVIIVEACAQLSLICYKSFWPENADRLVLFGGIDKVRFRGAVKPGDRLVLLSKVTEASRRGARSLAQAFVKEKLVFEGEFLSVSL